MNNFSFQNATKIIFGKGTEENVGEETKLHADKVLLHYGGGSIKQSGLYDRVTASLKKSGVVFVELAGVKPNPRLSLVKEGIKICRDNGIKFILAVGGGSVIDSAKAIAVGVPYSGDVWDFYDGKGTPKEALKVATVLTIPAAGSESSPSSVISDDEKQLKRGLTVEIIRPVFSIMNPELTYTLPEYQTACGAADIMAHIMERYFTNTTDVELTDRLCEATMKTLINNVPKILKKPDDYASRAEVMWTGCVAHNDILGTGREGDWGSHMIEHEISAIYDVAHGAGLSVVFPAWMKYVYKHNVNRFVQFASRVFNVEIDFYNPEKTALEGIRRLEMFFESIGLPVRLSQMNIKDDKISEMAAKSTQKDSFAVGNFVKLKTSDVAEILKLAL
ncbi:MAG TPA: iron-containing alcohol dehydrogenase [Spirochaetota bacterium]|nr:iron-containing alcohol dehydrogenase [Spirochaetota bacterium]HOR45014.1 iron-containing alcohol dehydrogenase [Spirochaetota bacterium]HPK56533.1 iron-containing alcohol dehydrogenase [Spirochaetota bacterium]